MNLRDDNQLAGGKFHELLIVYLGIIPTQFLFFLG